MSFSQLPAVEKDTKKGAAGIFLGPSYFEATLRTLMEQTLLCSVHNKTLIYINMRNI